MYWFRVPYSTHEGLVSKAAPGTHEAVVSMLLRNSVPKESKLVDLAAGTGSLLSRLKSLGYKDIEAVELNVKAFGLPQVEPNPLDLNDSFSNHLPKNYRLVTAIEIIEHLDSPREFLKQVHKILENNGYLIVSTPNTAHWLGRLNFLFTGFPKYFSKKDFYEQRHLSPILDFHMRIMLEEIGFKLVDFESTASSWGILLKFITFPISFLFRLLPGQQHIDGNINIYLARKQ